MFDSRIRYWALRTRMFLKYRSQRGTVQRLLEWAVVSQYSALQFKAVLPDETVNFLFLGYDEEHVYGLVNTHLLILPKWCIIPLGVVETFEIEMKMVVWNNSSRGRDAIAVARWLRNRVGKKVFFYDHPLGDLYRSTDKQCVIHCDAFEDIPNSKNLQRIEVLCWKDPARGMNVYRFLSGISVNIDRDNLRLVHSR